MAHLKIADREAELILSMTSWEEIEEQVERLDEIDALMESRQRLRNIRTIAGILSAEGARLGKGEEMPADWLKEHCPPRQAIAVSTAIRAAIVEGMRMESNTAENGDQVVDAALAEIEKKEPRDA